jgi:hypothetical protein
MIVQIYLCLPIPTDHFAEAQIDAFAFGDLPSAVALVRWTDARRRPPLLI